jgi:hypothetical protein
VTAINNEVDRHARTSQEEELADLERYVARLRDGAPEARAVLEQAYLMLWRRHLRTVAELDAAQCVIADGNAPPVDLAQQTKDAIPPEVLLAMSVRSSRMRPVMATMDDRDFVFVVPPQGVDNPQETWRRLREQRGRHP